MELGEAVRSRRSIRKYQNREVPTETILKAIEMASWAPNTGGFQGWKFYVVKSPDVINRIGNAVQAKVDLIVSWPEAELHRETMARHQAKCAFFRAAPVLILISFTRHHGPAEKVLQLRGAADPDAAEMIANRTLINARAQTVAAAATLMSLGLHSLGLGSCWLAGPMLARKEIEQMVGVAADEELFALISVGYPAETPEPKPRKAMEESVRII